MLDALIDDAHCGVWAAHRIEMKTEWDVESAIATYNVDRWGEGYFTVNNSGNVEARREKKERGAGGCLRDNINQKEGGGGGGFFFWGKKPRQCGGETVKGKW